MIPTIVMALVPSQSSPQLTAFLLALSAVATTAGHAHARRQLRRIGSVNRPGP